MNAVAGHGLSVARVARTPRVLVTVWMPCTSLSSTVTLMPAARTEMRDLGALDCDSCQFPKTLTDPLFAAVAERIGLGQASQ